VESSNTLGRYQIIREIARSNDVIYEAVDPAINRRVALKELCLPPNLTGAQKRERIERFYREAKAAGKLSHPNIVTIYGAGEENGRYYIAMEFLEGQDLQNVLRVRGAMPVQEAISIVLQICDALAYAHQQGVIHRDIKPDNIQVLAGGVVKLTDFGIARLMNEPSITSDGQVFGTPSYMSPEQVAGKPLDHRTDIFSLGVVLYEILVGRKPFVGDSVVTITYNIMNLEPTPPAGIPAYLQQVIRKAIAKDPNQRYTTAGEMADDIRSERVSGFPSMMTGQFAPQPLGGYGGPSAPPPDPYAPAGYQDPIAFPPPGGYQPQSGYQPQAPPSPQAPDPFGSIKPIDLPPPAPVRRPIFSPDITAFFGLMAIVLTLIGLFLFAIWALNAAYQGYTERQGESRAARDMELGEKAYQSGDYDTAIQHFRRVLEITPKSITGGTARRDLASCFVGKGNAQYNAGLYGPAADFYREAVNWDSKSPGAHCALGNALQQLGNEDGALSEWRTAVEVGPGTKEALMAGESAGRIYFRQGENYQNAGDANSALQAYSKVMEVAPGSDISRQAQDRINQLGGTPSL
jgi:serine/threonine protein kinase